jgi:aromatic amino acid aminotransferase I
MLSEKGSKAIDLSHHLSDASLARKVSPLKGLSKFTRIPGMILLAGGLPHPKYFPFSGIHVDGLAKDSFAVESMERLSLSWLWNIFSTKEKTIPFTVPKYPVNPEDVNLAVALQYDGAEGIQQLTDLLHDFTAKIFQPAYKDWDILNNLENTDA